jgi:predicted Zn-dependent protease
MKLKLKSLMNSYKRFVLVAACLTLSACQILNSAEELAGTDDTNDTNIGPALSFESQRANDPQASIGAQEHPKILESHGGAYSNRQLDTTLAVIVGKLVEHSNAPDKSFQITVLNSPTVNAFALPGGYLYVTRGLLTVANDMSEVAAVLAHEMAHVSANHGIERGRQQKANDIAGRVISEVVSNPLAGKVAEASAKRKFVAFSQAQELQADAISIKIIGKAGYDPFAAARFLESMDRFTSWRAGSGDKIDDHASSHPSTPQRIELAKRHARAQGPSGTGERGQERFLKGIDGILFGDTATEGFIRGNRFSHRKLGFKFQVPDNFNLTNKTEAVLAGGPDQMALRFDAVDKSETDAKSPADYLRSGWVNGLDEATVQSKTTNGKKSASGQAEAGDWQFGIEVISYGEKFYRFILAAPRNAKDVAKTTRQIAGSFKAISSQEKKNLRPLKVTIKTVKSGDTIANLADRMVGVSKKVELFKALNGLGRGQRVKPGQKVKIISD